jgi:hypothetical protein
MITVIITDIISFEDFLFSGYAYIDCFSSVCIMFLLAYIYKCCAFVLVFACYTRSDFGEHSNKVSLTSCMELVILLLSVDILLFLVLGCNGPLPST